jgi:predicted DNA-binding transcriptional regulator AlpA
MNTLETTAKVAERLRVTTRTLARWREVGCGPRYVRIGQHKIGYPADEVDRWLAARTHESRAAEAASAAA